MSHEPIICEKHGMTSCLDCYRPTVVKIEIEPTPEEFWASLTPERRLALAKAAPRVAGVWVRTDRNEMRRLGAQCFGFDNIGGVASVFIPGPQHVHIFLARVWVGNENWSGRFQTLTAAQSACDAELIRLGYVLEPSE